MMIEYYSKYELVFALISQRSSVVYIVEKLDKNYVLLIFYKSHCTLISVAIYKNTSTLQKDTP